MSDGITTVFSTPQLDNATTSGVENLLGYADDLDAQTMRDRLALATRYLANWYKATKGTDDQGVWWQQIDTLRASVESVYKEMTDPANSFFAAKSTIGHYNDAANAWSDLWRRITLSIDANQISLMSALPDLPSAILEAPGVILPQIGNELGKIIGGTLGQFLRQTWPYLAVAGAVGLVYVFRAPLSKLAGKVV
jgi:hypothetical protein